MTFSSRAILIASVTGAALALSACGQDATTETKVVDTAVKAEAELPKAPEPRDIASHVGEYPSDSAMKAPTEGKAPVEEAAKTDAASADVKVAFMQNPAVQSALFKIMLPPSARAFITAPATESPVFKAGNMVVAHGCQPHNCMAKNWTVAVSADGGKALACTFEAKEGETNGVAIWYDGVKPVSKRAEGCPQDAAQYSAAQSV